MAGMEDGAQKYQKVYSFLKRALSQDRYEGIRSIEPCVIVAEGFNKAFKFAILGDEMLYITENPPRAPKDIQITVELSTVTSVKLIYDVAEFLGGDLKTKVQHILITYKKPIIKSRSASTGDFSPRQALKMPLLTASALFQVESDQYGSNNSHSLSQTPLSQNSYSQLRMLNSLAEQTGKLKLSASEGNIHQRIEEERLQSASSSSLKRNLLLPVCTRPLPAGPPGGMSSNLSDTPNTRRRKKTRPKQRQEQDTDPLDSSASSSDLDFSFRSNSPLPPDLQPTHSYERFRAPSPRDISQTSLQTRKHNRNSSNESTGSSTDILQVVDNDVHSQDTETDEMHIYILDGLSPMFAFLKSTWNNCIMKSTLQFSAGASSPRTSTKIDNSQLLTLFNQLKADILQSHRMENNFVLINELLTAALKSFSLKKFFWKSPELFHFIVEQIQLYLPHSPSRQSKKRGYNRHDEFDYVVVLLQTLECMFRDTEILISRLNVIKAHKGQTLRRLLEHIIATPTVGRKSVESSISPAAQLLLSGSSGELIRSKKEEETNELLKEITDCVTSVLYEIIAAVHQTSNFSVENNVLNIVWLMAIVDSHDATETFVKRMMERQMAIILTDHKHLSPPNTVVLYRQLYILHNLLEYSTQMAVSIPRNYAEEFRYYIKRHIEKKLPVKYPLTSPLLSLLEQVSRAILKSIKSSFR